MSTGNGNYHAQVSREVVPLQPADQALTRIYAVERPGGGGYHRLHRALRGRYVLATILALIGGCMGGWGGWRLAEPLYRSEGLLRIAYKLPTVLKQNEWNGPMDMFEANMRSQQQVLGSRRTIEQAMKLPQWQKTQRGNSTAVVDQVARDLVVEHPTGTDYLRVSVLNADPAIAAAAVRSIIEAYVAIYNSRDSEYERKMLETLTQIQEQSCKVLDACQVELDAAVNEFGTTDLAGRCESMADQVEQLERKLAQLELALAVRKVERDPKAGADANEMSTPTVEELAAVGGQLASQLTDRSRIGAQVEQLKRMYGDKHPLLEQMRGQLAVIEKQIEQNADAYSKLMAKRSRVGGDLIAQDQPVEVLEAQRQQITTLRDTTRQKMVALGIRRSQLDKTKAKAEQARTELAKAQGKLDEMAVESTLGGRLSVISSGEAPATPFLDRRPKMAAAGAFGGIALPIGLLLLWSVTRNRYRFSSEAECGVPLLGVLPRLSEDLRGVDSVGVAHSVHRIRAMLQVGQGAGRPATYLVTSASPGEGKTSLTAALALSFAASGSRTLMIDSDCIGQHLTARFGAREMPGLREALSRRAMNGCTKQLDDNLSLMPLGGREVGDACTTSPGALRQLIRDMCGAFDVVLVDSGPLHGTAEPILLAPEVYGVILTVARGQRHAAVENALQHLKAIGAKVVGVVFNFAERRDFQRSTSVSAERMSRPAEATPSIRGVGDGLDAHAPADNAMVHLRKMLTRVK